MSAALAPRPIQRIDATTVVLATDNIDTDQIYPGRFLTVTTREGLGEMLFADWRKDGEGRLRPEFALNAPEARGAQVLVAGRNFGCGSSREHAVWALTGYGFRAVISTSIADIFRRNAIKNGLLPIAVDDASYVALAAAPGFAVAIDLERQTVSLPSGGLARFEIEPFARYCLMQGVDELQFLQSQDKAIREYEKRVEG